MGSAEYRMVRGDLLDAQKWTARSWVTRSLTFAGIALSGYQFAVAADVAQGFGTFGSTIAPAAQTLWPDSTVDQLNRISDVGFQTDKVIPKDASDIVVAFFPIDRFLTPELKKIYLHEPAAFYIPAAGILDKQTRKPICDVLQRIFPAPNGNAPKSGKITGSEQCGGIDLVALASAECPAKLDDSETAKNTCKEKAFLNQLSLNQIRVQVGGTMTVDVDTIPASIDRVQFDNDKDGSNVGKVWGVTTEQSGTIYGRYLSNGKPEIVDENGLTAADWVISIDGMPDTSTDTALRFKMTLKNAVETTPPKLYLRVNKTAKDGTVVSSYKYDLSVPPIPKTPDKTNSSSSPDATQGAAVQSDTATPDATHTPAPKLAVPPDAVHAQPSPPRVDKKHP